jgi:hypothetical protein
MYRDAPEQHLRMSGMPDVEWTDKVWIIAAWHV